MINTNKTIGAVILLLVLAVGGYVVYGGSQSRSESVNIVSGEPISTAATSSTGRSPDRALQQIQRLQAIQLDKNFLASQPFRSLKNFGVAIKPLPTGRENPFSPAGVQIRAEVTESTKKLQLPQGPTATSSKQPSTTTPARQSTSTAATTKATSSTEAQAKTGTSSSPFSAGN